jgi:hypothetical protein|nr:MAG TPA: hypothetical protein [Caudoviricetes sp.]
MYKFYLEIKTEEHMLYPKEIAEAFGLYSMNGKPHSILIKAIILDYLESKQIEYTPIFYNSRNGLKEVFSAKYYMPALQLHLSKANHNNVYISQNGKKYKYFFKQKERV